MIKPIKATTFVQWLRSRYTSYRHSELEWRCNACSEWFDASAFTAELERHSIEAHNDYPPTEEI